ncbi:amidase [Thalassobacillus sp. CUG 92003]|uniref:amidase n=1 Tax=Thalassobacillus sp. CUG 92003 TaxID=2736641 RepID=UPI0015E69AED|nr:amidase [Thalassobacillus sp. CUG 92003]
MNNDVLNMDGVAQAELLRANLLSSQELTQYYIDRIKTLNPPLNAVVSTMFDEALNQAYSQSYAPGPFAGMPYLIKDLNAVKGQPLTLGTKIMEGYIAPDDDQIVKRARQAGMVMLGKTNTPEFGFTPTTESPFLGPSRNPWDLSRSSGGSSGGAAAAVATGMIPFAQGSDGGGSIRIPACCTGLFGMKPTRGRMPISVVMNGFATTHALTRSVRDSAALLDAMGGPKLGEGYAAPMQHRPFQKEVKEEPRPLKIGYMTDMGGDVPFDPEVSQAVEATARLCEKLGHHVERAAPSYDHWPFYQAFETIWAVGGALSVEEACKLNDQAITRDNMELLLYSLYEKGPRISSLEYEKARQFLAQQTESIAAFYEDFDVWLTPTLAQLPIELGRYDTTRKHADEIMAISDMYCPHTPIANVTGQPAMSVPLHWSKDNLPIGSHFMGRFGDEATLFQLAAQLERAQPWWGKYAEIQ